MYPMLFIMRYYVKTGISSFQIYKYDRKYFDLFFSIRVPIIKHFGHAPDTRKAIFKILWIKVDCTRYTKGSCQISFQKYYRDGW